MQKGKALFLLQTLYFIWLIKNCSQSNKKMPAELQSFHAWQKVSRISTSINSDRISALEGENIGNFSELEAAYHY